MAQAQVMTRGMEKSNDISKENGQSRS